MDINIQIMKQDNLLNLISVCKELAFDLDFKYAKSWKSEQADRVLVGYMPIYFPREIVHAGQADLP